MLSRKQKEKLKKEWQSCPDDEKQMIMADFMRCYADDLSWETWMIFLGEQLTLSSYKASTGTNSRAV